MMTDKRSVEKTVCCGSIAVVRNLVSSIGLNLICGTSTIFGRDDIYGVLE